MFTARTHWFLAFALAAASTVSAHASVHKTADDANIAVSITAALDTAPALGGESSIQVQSIGHVVYLHGLVDTYPQKALVEAIAEKTPGVDRVVNSLELRNE